MKRDGGNKKLLIVGVLLFVVLANGIDGAFGAFGFWSADFSSKEGDCHADFSPNWFWEYFHESFFGFDAVFCFGD